MHTIKTSPAFTNNPPDKPSFAFVVHGSSSTVDSRISNKTRTISLKEHDLLVSEKVIVEISRENFEVHVQEIRIWSINILDDSSDSHTSKDDNEDTKIDRHEDVNLVDDLDKLIYDLNDDKGKNDELKEDNNEPFNNNLESQKVEGNNIQ
ncbi:hypothetical protein Tco_1327452 [Tanacetum coccineum]